MNEHEIRIHLAREDAQILDAAAERLGVGTVVLLTRAIETFDPHLPYDASPATGDTEVRMFRLTHGLWVKTHETAARIGLPDELALVTTIRQFATRHGHSH